MSHRAEAGLPTELGRGALVAARTTWIVLVVVTSTLVITGLIRAYADPMLVAMPPLTDLFVELGLDFRLMITIALAVPFIAVVVISAYVFFKRSADPMSLLFTATLVILYAFSSRALLTFAGVPVLEHAIDAAGVLVAISMALTLGLFPNGIFVPRSSRWLAPLMVVPLLLEPRIGSVVMSTMAGGRTIGWQSQLSAILWIGLVFTGMFCQVYRYRRASTIEERQQTKLVVAPLCLLFAVLLVALAVLASNPDSTGGWIAWLIFAAIPISVTLPLGVAAAIMRYRLFEVDRLISRTVSYGLVVATLGAVYFATVAAITWLLPSNSSLGVATSTLIVAAAFNPLRRRVRDAVDRRFNRSRQRAKEISEDFSEAIRDSSLTVGELEFLLLGTVNDALEPARSVLWLPEGSRTGD